MVNEYSDSVIYMSHPSVVLLQISLAPGCGLFISNDVLCTV